MFDNSQFNGLPFGRPSHSQGFIIRSFLFSPFYFIAIVRRCLFINNRIIFYMYTTYTTKETPLTHRILR